MPKIDMNAYDEAQETSFDNRRLTAGGYVAKIIAVRDTWKDAYGKTCTAEEKEYVKLIFDIDEGELAGIFSDDFWSTPDKDWGHWICLSWKNLSMLKSSVRALEESNHGFDVMAAINSDDWGKFIGKKVGIVVGEQTYEKDGEIKTRCKLPNLRSVTCIKDGRFKVPELDTTDTNGRKPGDESAAIVDASCYDEDIPF